MSDVLVKVDNVSKRFCRSLKRSLWYGLQDLGSELSHRRYCGGGGLPRSSADVELRKDEFWAVKDVSFELRRGDCLGLIGRNGAGKSTLLRMLNGLIKPDTGNIQMHGSVGAIIALGSGFNPTLTGRENIKTSTSLAGLSSKATQEVIDEIVDFAEINDFIDSPVQSYSSGMQVRLGFAAASIISPDILILDEVLAVGDAGFRLKCYNKLSKIKDSTAIVFVSHSMSQIQRLCSQSILLSQGQTIYDGETSAAIKGYNDLFAYDNNGWMEGECTKVEKILINNSSDTTILCKPGEKIEAKIWLRLENNVANAEVLFSLLEKSGEITFQATNTASSEILHLYSGASILKLTISTPLLGSSDKLISIQIRNRVTKSIILWAHQSWILKIDNPYYVQSLTHGKLTALVEDN